MKWNLVLLLLHFGYRIILHWISRLCLSDLHLPSFSQVNSCTCDTHWGVTRSPPVYTDASMAGSSARGWAPSLVPGFHSLSFQSRDWIFRLSCTSMYLLCSVGNKFRLVKCLLGNVFYTYYKKSFEECSLEGFSLSLSNSECFQTHLATPPLPLSCKLVISVVWKWGLSLSSLLL